KIEDVEEVWIRTRSASVGQRLVDVVVGEELSSKRANIADLHRRFAAELLLDIDVVVVHPGGADVLVHGERVLFNIEVEHRRGAERRVRDRDRTRRAGCSGVPT